MATALAHWFKPQGVAEDTEETQECVCCTHNIRYALRLSYLIFSLPFLKVAEQITRTTCTRTRTKTKKPNVGERYEDSKKNADNNEKFVDEKGLPTSLQLQK
eukprot:2108120-Amphidinium_carterae.2